MKKMIFLFLCCFLVQVSGFSQYFTEKKRFSEITDFYFCGGSIIFEPSGIFFLERGCEGNSRAAYGHYKINQHTIHLRYASFDSLQLIKQIEYLPKESKDTIIKVMMLDRYHDSIAAYKFDYYSGTNKRMELFYDNVMKLPPNGILVFNSTGHLFERSFKDSIIQIPTTHQDMIIHFNVPDYYLFYNVYEELPDDGKPRILYIKKDGLYTNKKTRLFKP